MLKLYPTVQEIIVITDGGSNFGGDPVQAALEANALGYTVSALGIVDADCPDDEVYHEVQKIGAAGGGVSELVKIQSLAAALARVVRETAEKRLAGIIEGQLKSLLEIQEEIALPDQAVKRPAELTVRLFEGVSLRCVMAVDCSRSMEAKLPWVKESVIDLLASWQSKAGKIEMAVLCYPGQSGELTRTLVDFTSDSAYLGKKISDMIPGGGTPTAPGIRGAVRLLRGRRQATINPSMLMETGTVCL